MEEFENLSYPVFIISQEKIIYANSATSLFLGYSKEELIGKDRKEIIKGKIVYSKSYTGIIKFIKKNKETSFYAYTSTPYKKGTENYTIIKFEGLHIISKILTTVIEKKRLWKKEKIIETTSEEIKKETDIDRVRLYIVKERKDKEIVEVSLLYEYTESTKNHRWPGSLIINNLSFYTSERLPVLWLYDKERKGKIPPGIWSYIDKNAIGSILIKPIYINNRTLYLLSFEKLRPKEMVSSVDINLILYMHKVFEDLFEEKVKDIYEENLANFRKAILGANSRENLLKAFSNYILLNHDKILIDASLKEEGKIEILSMGKEKTEKSLLDLSLYPSSKDIKEYEDKIVMGSVDYFIMNTESLKKWGKENPVMARVLEIGKIQSGIFIFSRGETILENFIFLLKKDRDYYKKEDIHTLDSFIKECLLSLKNFRILEELKKERKQAENALKLQKFFLERISHEFRTPITGILGFSDLLSEMVTTNEGIGYINAIKESTVRLLNLVDKLLLLAKLESGKVKIGEAGFTFYEIEDWLRNKLKKEVKPGITYSIKFPEFPHLLIGDIEKIKTIFKELIENAIKFTSEGRIEVKGFIIKEDIDSVLVRFSIKDTGVGISKDKIKYIFSDFAQEEEDIARSYEGMGLGLSIVKRLLDYLDGDIWVESNKDKGSTFYFEIKLKREIKDKLFHNKKILIDAKDELIIALLKVYIKSMGAIPVFKEEYDISIQEDELTLPLSKKEIKYILRKKIDIGRKIVTHKRVPKILVAEDNALNYKYISTLINSLGMVSENAKNGKEVLEMFEKGKYDLIIMDIQMPIIDGIEATKAIRKMDNQIPIIALTAAAVDEVEEKAKEVGVNEYITKPFAKETLKKTILKYIKKDENNG